MRCDPGGVQWWEPYRAPCPTLRRACAPRPTPPRLGAAERVVNAGGGGARAEVEEGAGVRLGAFSPLLQQETAAAAAESLSLSHVIVSKRELRGSRRLGDHYKTQSGERVAATAAAAASPAPDRPGRAAATERPGPAPRPLGARRSPSACAPRPAPPPLLKLSPHPRRKATAYSSTPRIRC